MEILLSLFAGLGLAAAAGFRVFVPLLAVGLAARFEVLALSDGFAWMGSNGALIVFATATLVELLGYYLPWVDNLLDTIASPAAVVAGIVLTAAVLTDLDPTLRWALAVVAGGGTSATFQGLTAGTRAVTTFATGGVANPLVSTVEALASTLLAALAVLVPIAAAASVVLLFAFVAKRTVLRRRRPAGPGPTPGELTATTDGRR